MELLDSVVFRAPATALLSGPTMSGKSHFLVQILTNIQTMMSPPPDRIVYCYARPQEKISSLPGIELTEGLPDLDSFDSSINNLVILDDLIDECESNPAIQKLFTVDCHHKNISTFLVTQNLFSKGKCARTISLNCNYMIIFNNPRDRQQIQHLSRQIFPSNPQFLNECYIDACESKDYGYLFLDLHQKTKQKHRVQTNVIPGETRIIYQSK
jgi:hypothetical protein